MKFKHLAFGGTFDHFHLGHQYFLKTCLNHSQKITCGITTGWANKDKVLGELIEPYSSRLKSVRQFLQANDLLSRSTLIPLNNIFGPTIVAPADFDGLAITQETIPGAQMINEARKKRGLAGLKLLKIKFTRAQDCQPISSTRIRLGEINRQGFVYKNVLLKNKTIIK